MDLKQNDLITLEITGMTAEKMSVGRWEGLCWDQPQGKEINLSWQEIFS